MGHGILAARHEAVLEAIFMAFDGDITPLPLRLRTSGSHPEKSFNLPRRSVDRKHKANGTTRKVDQDHAGGEDVIGGEAASSHLRITLSSRACWSGSMRMNSTPSDPSLDHRLTARSTVSVS